MMHVNVISYLLAQAINHQTMSSHCLVRLMCLYAIDWRRQLKAAETGTGSFLASVNLNNKWSTSPLKRIQDIFYSHIISFYMTVLVIIITGRALVYLDLISNPLALNVVLKPQTFRILLSPLVLHIIIYSQTASSPPFLVDITLCSATDGPPPPMIHSTVWQLVQDNVME